MLPISVSIPTGLTFDVATWGDGDRLALCLHGFPESSYSWRFQGPVLAELGYRAWAPDQRGYSARARPGATRAYRLRYLIDDVAALIDASAARSVTLIGHDWGAMVAWWFAIRRTRPLERLVICNVPHPATFVANLGPRQLLRSWYAFAFQVPCLPEALLGAAHAAPVAAAIRRSSADPSRFPDDVLDVYRRKAAEPGALRAMLDWYRANFRGGLAEQFRLGVAPIDVPTLVVWGCKDVALGEETLRGLDRYVQDLTVHRLAEVSHWVQQEAPEAVNDVLRAWLSSTR